MSDKNIEVFCSEVFRFDVGPSRKRFYVHQAAVSRVSEPLKAMMTGGLKESCENFACLEYVDENIFARFLEFVYSGSYNRSEPHEDDCPSGTIEYAVPPSEEEVIDSRITSSRRIARRLKHEYIPQDNQVKLLAPIEFGITKVIPFPVESASINNLDRPAWNYSAVFLSHAQLFDFAELYLIDGLRELTAQNLYTALNTFTLHTQRVQDVVQLVKHVYDVSPEPRESQQSVPSLRRVVSHFTANNIHVLVTSKKFHDLLVDGGFFVKDLVLSTVERM